MHSMTLVLCQVDYYDETKKHTGKFFNIYIVDKLQLKQVEETERINVNISDFIDEQHH